MPSKVNKICNKIVKNFIILSSFLSFISFAPYIFTLELYVCKRGEDTECCMGYCRFFLHERNYSLFIVTLSQRC